MRVLLCAAVLAMVSATASAQAPQVERINVLDFGIYTAKFTQKGKDERTASGHVNTLAGYKLVKQTETISARIGQRFGIKYVVVGKPKGKVVTLDWLTRFPPQGVVNPKGEKFSENQFTRTAIIGETTFRSYTFEEAWELVPGTWVFEFYYQGRKLGEKRFNVVVGE